MTFSQSLGLNLTPLVLRLALAAVFIWAGVNKLFYTQEFTGAQATRLAELGMADSATPTGDDEFDEPYEDGPTGHAPSTGFSIILAQEEAPADEPTEEPVPESPEESPEQMPADDTVPVEVPEVEMPIVDPSTGPDAGTPEAVTQTIELENGVVIKQRLYGLVLFMDYLSTPDADGNTYWPSWLAEPTTMMFLAWIAAITEFVGGLCLLIGLLTRLWGFLLAGTMGTAMWMSQIVAAITGTHAVKAGPYSVSTITEDHPAILGVLPPLRFDDPTLATQSWSLMLFQLVLIAAALGLLFSGAGALSLDRAIFGGKKKKPVKTGNA